MTDGALFALVEATDTELFLLLKVQRAGSGTQWRYGFARMASVRLKATRANAPLWEVKTLEAVLGAARFIADPNDLLAKVLAA